MAVMAIKHHKEFRYFDFDKDHLNLETSTTHLDLSPKQSISPVHYLAISPPRIRITDDQGRVSPDMYSYRREKRDEHRRSSEPIKSLTKRPTDDFFGALLSLKKPSEKNGNEERRNSSSSSSCSSDKYSRRGSMDSRISSDSYLSRGGGWSTRSR